MSSCHVLPCHYFLQLLIYFFIPIKTCPLLDVIQPLSLVYLLPFTTHFPSSITNTFVSLLPLLKQDSQIPFSVVQTAYKMCLFYFNSFKYYYFKLSFQLTLSTHNRSNTNLTNTNIQLSHSHFITKICHITFSITILIKNHITSV